MIALDQGQTLEGGLLLERIAPSHFRTDNHLVNARKWILAQLAARRVMRTVSGVIAVAAAVYLGLAALAGDTLGACAAGALFLGCLALRAGIQRAWRRQLTRHLRGPFKLRMNLTSMGVLTRSAVDTSAQ